MAVPQSCAWLCFVCGRVCQVRSGAHAAPSRLHHAAAVLLPAVAVTVCWIPLDGGTRGQHAADGWRWLMHTSSNPNEQATASPCGLPHPPDTTRRLCAPGWSLQRRWGPPAGQLARRRLRACGRARVAHHAAAAGLCVISPAPTTAVHEGARWHGGHPAAGRMGDMLLCMWQSFPCLCFGSPTCAGLDGCEGEHKGGAGQALVTSSRPHCAASQGHSTYATRHATGSMLCTGVRVTHPVPCGEGGRHMWRPDQPPFPQLGCAVWDPVKFDHAWRPAQEGVVPTRLHPRVRSGQPYVSSFKDHPHCTTCISQNRWCICQSMGMAHMPGLLSRTQAA
jgi:hypothetical protein